MPEPGVHDRHHGDCRRQRAVRAAVGVETTTSTGPTAAPESDAALVSRCLRGDQSAWERLVDRYKRSGGGATASPEARGTEGLAGLVRVAHHKAIKWKTRARRQAASAQVEDDVHGLVDATPTADQLLEQLQRELAVRAAVTALPKRCRQLVEQLFFTTPPPPTPRSPSVSGSLPARSGSSVGGA